ncbi:MAG: 3,4-dihydroxy-2-butanone-4-phosphate synthase [Phycisphaerales bacterium]|nr:3,4-dihydroxy-2-butanone-4-phosphate synthase [Phycisphaerales bacterium]
MPTSAPAGFSPIPEILDELRAGRMVVLTDDEDRENEGDLVLPAQFADAATIGFMLKEARGYLCLSLTEADCNRLDLTPQSQVNTSVRGTPFTVAIDGHPRHGFTTGVSADERAKTIRLAIDPASTPGDFVRPGHINPLRARDGGVLVRIGQTEGSVDLCRLAGLTPSAVIIEILRDDGNMARVPDLIDFNTKHNLKMCSVKQLIEYRLSSERFVERLEPEGGTTIETAHGPFNLIGFRSITDPLPHLALTLGGVGDLDAQGAVIEQTEPTLVRVHRRDLLGDIFAASQDGRNTRSILDSSMRQIQDAGRGAIIYLRPSGGLDQPGDAGLSTRLTRPFDSNDDDSPRQSQAAGALEYGTGSQIVRALGISQMQLLTNSDADYPQLEAFGLSITERVSL